MRSQSGTITRRDSNPGTRQNLLVLSEEVSGMNRFLFRELGKEFDLSVVDVPRTDPRRLLRAALSFHPSRPRWRKRFTDAQMQYWVSPECFEHRTALARKAL